MDKLKQIRSNPMAVGYEYHYDAKTRKSQLREIEYDPFNVDPNRFIYHYVSEPYWDTKADEFRYNRVLRLVRRIKRVEEIEQVGMLASDDKPRSTKAPRDTRRGWDFYDA